MNNKHKSKQEFANELNMSVKTLYRLMKKLGIPFSGSLLSPSECKYIANRLDEHKFSQTLGRPGENRDADSGAAE